MRVLCGMNDIPLPVTDTSTVFCMPIIRYLDLDNREASIGEQIYIPQHPNGWGKELAIFDSSTSSGRCQILDVTSPGCTNASANDYAYTCDTELGSSGSPVISNRTNQVIALHHCGTEYNCTFTSTTSNQGVPVIELFPHIGPYIYPDLFNTTTTTTTTAAIATSIVDGATNVTIQTTINTTTNPSTSNPITTAPTTIPTKPMTATPTTTPTVAMMLTTTTTHPTIVSSSPTIMPSTNDSKTSLPVLYSSQQQMTEPPSNIATTLNRTTTTITATSSSSSSSSSSCKFPLTFHLTTDRFGPETTWTLESIQQQQQQNSTILASGGGYDSQRNYTDLLCLPHAGKYLFSMKDEFHDGICCMYGNGSYSISFNGTILTMGGRYHTWDNTTFVVGTN